MAGLWTIMRFASRKASNFNAGFRNMIVHECLSLSLSHFTLNWPAINIFEISGLMLSCFVHGIF